MDAVERSNKATRTRYWVVVSAVLLSIITYIDRVAISQAAPLITAELGLTREEMAWVFSAFGLKYFLFQIPGGWLSDWIGPRRVLAGIVIWWSVFTATFPGPPNFSRAMIRHRARQRQAGAR